MDQDRPRAPSPSESAPGAAPAPRGHELDALLADLTGRFIALSPDRQVRALDDVVLSIGRFLGADQIDLWRSEADGGRWLQAWWAGTNGDAEPREIDVVDLARWDSPTGTRVVPLRSGAAVLGHLVIHGAGTRWGASGLDEQFSRLGRTLAHLTNWIDSLRWLGRAFRTSPLPMAVTEDGCIVHANAALARFLGAPDVAALVGGDLSRHCREARPLGRRATDGADECEFQRIDGSTVWGRVTSTECDTPDGHALAFVQVEDLTEARAARSQLEAMPDDEMLAGLADRSTLMDAIAEELAARPQRRTCLLLVDIDRVDSINASLGEDEGDRLLDLVAGRLRLATRGNDVVSRLGGDQFAVLLRSPVDEAEAVLAADRLLALLREPMQLAGQRVVNSASIGIASSTAGASLESMLRDADSALRHAKLSGRNGYVLFDAAFRSAVASRARIEGELRVALSGDQLQLHFQPEVDLLTGSVVGVEALARWRHPTMGLLSADSFVTVAEDIGLASDLGRWALTTACDRLGQWTPRHPELTMRVNVSAAQLAGRALVDDVRAAIATSGIDPGRLCLEITETTVMTDVDVSMGVLADLHRLGVELAIDDFGTGFSSLAYLRSFPVATLKVDQSFVADVTDADGRAIVAAVLQLAASLDLQVIAEGIETERQWRELTALGCRRGQGHLFSPARPEGDLLQWLQSQELS